MDLRVGVNFRLKRKIGAGSFGEIYCGENVNNKEDVAIKLESVITDHPQLYQEAKICKMLSDTIGFPSYKWFGIEGDYHALVMNLLGHSLEEHFENCGRRLSLKTVLMVADQMILRIEYLHTRGLIHRDIKPDNFTSGYGRKQNVVIMIDFGLTKRYLDSRTNEHIPFREGRSLTGTARYSSINMHLGIEQSRRDDMEGIAYVLIYFLKGSLPWQGMKMDDKMKKFQLITEKKITTMTNVLCSGIPKEFADFLDAVRKLEFNEKPDYAGYRSMFRELFIREGFVYDYIYDWTQHEKTAQSIALVNPEANSDDEVMDSILEPKSYKNQEWMNGMNSNLYISKHPIPLLDTTKKTDGKMQPIYHVPSTPLIQIKPSILEKKRSEKRTILNPRQTKKVARSHRPGL